MGLKSYLFVTNKIHSLKMLCEKKIQVPEPTMILCKNHFVQKKAERPPSLATRLWSEYPYLVSPYVLGVTFI